MIQVYLSRRNLLALLSKLDRVQAGEKSACTLIKRDSEHPVYPMSQININGDEFPFREEVSITAVEDVEYYTDRNPGTILQLDVKSQKLGDPIHITVTETKAKPISFSEGYKND